MKDGWCKHFNGMRDEGATCKRGHDYRAICGKPDWGIFTVIPCNDKNETDVKCADFELPTEAELAEQEKEFQERFDFTQTAIALIVEKTKANPKWEPELDKKVEGCQGTVECPKCKGELHYSVAGGNNHIWGRCKTEECLSWMM